MNNSDVFDKLKDEMNNSDVFDKLKNEMNNSDVFDNLRNEMENSEIFDNLRNELENSDCGSLSDGVYVCKDNKCCGKYGICGTGSNFCSSGCKPNYGRCW
ncbi:carbohydrate-binding module family 18 protein [Piromyces sp. E2]|nr:carbohydrate-binding module family 18 protein [Piromyces sp. E2]|eukprot:OUM56866.1 carbohydrate-binding module family 18 protein [Piromyces sp. E2]